MRNLYKKNKYPMSCALCGQEVAAGLGILFAKKGRHVGFHSNKKPEWVVQHSGKCPLTKQEQ